MITIAQTIDTALNPLRKIASCIGAPGFDLAARLYVANAFFSSGILRFNDWKNGTFDTQLFLFELEHPVPGLSPEFAAYGATLGELILPILLVFGLFSRFAAVGILIMTAIIELTYIHSTDHILWAFLAASILIKGAGMFSADYWLVKFLRKE
jgi:putative oxidoreductase